MGFGKPGTKVTYMLCFIPLQVWYVTLALSKVYAVAWIKQIKQLLTMACNQIKVLKVNMYTCTSNIGTYNIVIRLIGVRAHTQH